MYENSTTAAPDSRPGRSRFASTALLLAGFTLSAALGACRESAATPESKAAPSREASSDPQAVLATVGDEKVTMADVRNRAGDQLDQLETQYQLAKSRIVRTALDSILLDKTINAEAKRTGKSVDELIAAEAGAEGLTPSEANVAAWYQANPNRTSGRTLEQLRPNIVELLRAERRRDAANKLQARLAAERKVAVTYDPYRLQFNNDKAPSLGKSDAPVTLVEFSDFQCPFCQGAVPTIKQVEKKYGDKVRIVYRQFPIPNLHPFALKAAEASLCANEQSKFWEMHDAMFADQKKLAVSDLKQTARQLGIDGKKFDACMDTGRYVEQVQNDQKEGQRAGVTGTPAIYLNGTPVEGGSVPFSVLDAAIERELARAKPGA